jgi:phenylalanine-4-hydroxylase
MRIYGAGILSSHGEIIRSLDDSIIRHTHFDILTCARTPYRYDTMQSEYFYIESFDELFSLFERDLIGIFDEALSLGDIVSGVYHHLALYLHENPLYHFPVIP